MTQCFSIIEVVERVFDSFPLLPTHPVPLPLIWPFQPIIMTHINTIMTHHNTHLVKHIYTQGLYINGTSILRAQLKTNLIDVFLFPL